MTLDITLPAHSAGYGQWPTDLSEVTRSRLTGVVHQPWQHQVDGVTAWQRGDDVVMATGTASGKSLVYQIAALETAQTEHDVTLYLAPTKALGHDQIRSFAWTGLTVAALDGDASDAERDWARHFGQVIVTNPDMVNVSLLPAPKRWWRILRRVNLIVVDEAHVYRGVFGSHVALVLRRLLRLLASLDRHPQIIYASATAAEPARSCAELGGRPVTEVTQSTASRGQLTFRFVQPNETETATRLTAQYLTDFVNNNHQAVAFVPSRKTCEWIAAAVRQQVQHPEGVRAYRAGLLPEERRELEQQLRSGEVRAVAATSALELGIDISGLDRVILCGWPGRYTSFWQQVGRAGRDQQPAEAVLIAADDVLDQYLIQRPELILSQPVERSSVDISNPTIAAEHLIAAASELPLTAADSLYFGDGVVSLASELTDAGRLRYRNGTWFPPPRTHTRISLRGDDLGQISIVHRATGELVGTVAGNDAPRVVHEGAIYVHQGQYWYVERLDLLAHVAFVVPTTDVVYTVTQSQKVITVTRVRHEQRSGAASMRYGEVELATQVTSYQRRDRKTSAILSTHSLDYPQNTLRTQAVWWSWSIEQLAVHNCHGDLAGGAHAAEHAAIGMLPLFTGCDRWDIGGLSTLHHPDTGELTIFVYDGHSGGAGYAKAAYTIWQQWLGATSDAISSCACDDGCPACVFSPKCGNGNHPLSKADAVHLLTSMLKPA